MNIVLVNHQDTSDIHSFSGTSYFMSKAIKDEFEKVIDYNSYDPPELNGHVYYNGVEPALKPLGVKLSSFLRSERVQADFILFIGGSSCIPYCDSDIPLVFWHDSTWHTFLQGYAKPDDFCQFKERYTNYYLWDKAVVQKTDLLVYSSHFIADACVRDYNISRDRVKVIPFGANITEPPTDAFLAAALERRLADRALNLTFIGKDWKRKGLHMAFLVAENLNAQGIETKLNVVGCNPDIPGMESASFVNHWGILDKSKTDDLKTLENILKGTHFLIHPALAEPFGIVMCEANAYGIPVIGTAVEGLKTTVKNDINGYLWDGYQGLAETIDLLKRIACDLPAYYPRLFSGALSEYKLRLNWSSNVRALRKTLEQMAGDKKNNDA